MTRLLFRGYLFARHDEAMGTAGITGTIGVRGVVRQGGSRHPCLVSDSLIEAIRVDQANGEFDQDRSRQCRDALELGQEVRITDGPFASLTAQIKALDDNGRVRLMLDLFGRATSLTIEDRSVLQLVGN